MTAKDERTLHEQYMRAALKLAKRGKGRTSPNPMVGALVVRDGRVVGQGYHHRAGEPHAEVLALRQAGDKARDATLYVTLEPCSHKGRTPPCAPQVIASGVTRVVAAMQDPNPKVSGSGFAILKNAGIQVISGVMEAEARAVNDFYIKHITTGEPYVILKGAMTLDGKIATAGGLSRWITGEAARRDAHKLRAEVDAVLIGITTLLNDNSRLTCRLPGAARQPYRIVLDTRLRARPDLEFCKLATDGKSIVVTSPDADPKKAQRLEKSGCKILHVKTERKTGRIAIPALLAALGKMDITSLLVEGGGTVHDAFLRAGRVDRVVIYVAPKILGGAHSRTLVDGIGFPSLDSAPRLKDIKITRLNTDIKIQGYPEK
jgi:diaminohydroxyphosphoribosylaminopyrimidine deaminase / 5-amino-6-(5-phosphoribosylamino)uracil reductase